LLKIKGDRPTVTGNTTAPCSLPPKCNIHCKKALSDCAKFRCWQRWRRTKGHGSRNFPTPTSFGSRHRCPHQNFAQLFYSVTELQVTVRIKSDMQTLNNKSPFFLF
jgi:hypothetical protein